MTDVARYLADRHAFRRKEIILPDGRTLGQAEETWQTESIFKPLDAQDTEGKWLHSLLYIELPRGHAKSTVAAAEAITVAIMERDFRIYVAAGDEDQAGITYEILKGMVERNPRLKRSFKIDKKQARCPATGSVIQVLSSDAPTSFGLGGIGRGYVFIADELWCWRGRDLWDSLWTATGKTPYWRGIVLSNAGYDFQSVAWVIRELCRTSGPPFYLYAPEGCVAGWLTPAWRELQRKSLPPDVYQRLIENKWVEGAGSFITRSQLDKCIDYDSSPALAGSPSVSYVAALDLGLKRDRTVLSVGHIEKDRVVLDSLKVWQGSKNEPVSIESVEQELLETSRRFRLRGLVCDPWQMQSSIQRLKSRLPIREFTFTSENVRRLSETLFNLIQAARLRLYPDTALERELLALNVVQKGYGWRIDHGSGGYSDMAMSLGMMALECLQHGGADFRYWLGTGPDGELLDYKASSRVKPGEDNESVKRSIVFVKATPEADGVLLKCIAPQGHRFFDSESGRDFSFGRDTQRWVPLRVAELLLSAHPQKFVKLEEKTLVASA